MTTSRFTTASVQKVIAIASGKGGVGKSTVAVNLAIALQKASKKVGILDADIYGPSIPHLLGLDEVKATIENKKIIPIEAYHLNVMSIGFLMDKKMPAIWRGPMASMALQQLFRDTAWEALDYLIVDLPPGTGDIPLTLAQKLPLTSAIVVTTPQQIALADVRKAIEMFQKVNVPILGLLENMSIYQCEHCHHETHLFGKGGAQQLSQDYNIPLLGTLPFSTQIMQQSETGIPLLIENPTHKTSQHYYDIALQVLKLNKAPVRRKFPSIIVEP
jgi:ATP-binding protein involved in chromosome partitioning